MLLRKKNVIDRFLLRRNDKLKDDEKLKKKFSAKLKHIGLSCRGTRHLIITLRKQAAINYPLPVTRGFLILTNIWILWT